MARDDYKELLSDFIKSWDKYIFNERLSETEVIKILTTYDKLVRNREDKRRFGSPSSKRLKELKERNKGGNCVLNFLLILCIINPHSYLEEYGKALDRNHIGLKHSNLYDFFNSNNMLLCKYMGEVKKELKKLNGLRKDLTDSVVSTSQKQSEVGQERSPSLMDIEEFKKRQASYLPVVPVQLGQGIEESIYSISGYLEKLCCIFSSSGEEDLVKSFENSLIENPHTQPKCEYNVDNFLQDIYGVSEGTLKELLSVLDVKGWLNIVGEPGTGKSTMARSLAYLMSGCKFSDYTFMVSFNESTSYEDFIGGIRQVKDRWVYIKGLFSLFCEKAKNDDSGHKYIFVIDELNRANATGVFGEVITAIEHRDFPIKTNSGEVLVIPSNLKLISTCNTLDNSTSKLDDAFHSRMAEYRMPKLEVDDIATSNDIKIGSDLYNLLCKVWGHFKTINDELAKNIYKGEENRIGVRFLYSACKKKEEGIFKILIRYDYIPMVERKMSSLQENEKLRIEKELRGLRSDLGI